MIEAILPPSILATCVSFHEAIAEKGLMKAIADRAAEHAAERAVVGIGIRKYSPEVLATVSGIRMFGVPVEVLYYVPVFTTLAIAFYKYWSFVIDDDALVPVKKRKWLRAIVLAFAGVFTFEVLVEPTSFLPVSEPLFRPACAPARKSNFLAIPLFSRSPNRSFAPHAHQPGKAIS